MKKFSVGTAVRVIGNSVKCPHYAPVGAVGVVIVDNVAECRVEFGPEVEYLTTQGPVLKSSPWTQYIWTQTDLEPYESNDTEGVWDE